jgi:hypothetical protein
MYLVLSKKPIVEKSKGKLTLMGIEKLDNIWRTQNGSKFRNNHVKKIWLDLVVQVD